MANTIESVKKYVRAANYLSAAQIYLRDNFLLERSLSFDDIKPRLLGHWGTSPGINFVYANLNYLIKKHGTNTLFILGPGHGFAALQANLFLEETLAKYYPQATRDAEGIAYVVKNFSWPYGFPSHSNPGTPGVILEGGELGYALSTAYGTVLDNPDLLTACLIGDGEAETGPTAAAWHLNKFIDPKTNGAVLPILHLNGYKISGPTIFGRMSNKELNALFSGYGYQPFIVEGKDIYEKMADVLEKSHQLVVGNAKTDAEELRALEEWLRSYSFEELFDKKKGFIKDVANFIPKKGLKMGDNKHAFGGKIVKDLILPDVKKYAEDASVPGTVGSSSMRRTGLFLNDVFKLNKKNKNFRLLSPDETYSNKLDAAFETTRRAFVWPIEAWDKDMGQDGRVMEMLSEHSLQGLLQGYVLTGRHAIFASYEAFIQIVSSMADQYAKFLRIAREIIWRGDIPSLNYILTSSGWRQEHNGFSHQNPGFIGNMLQKHGCFIKAYFPPDGNSTLVCLRHCLRSKNEINIIVAGKTLEPRWLTVELAEKELEQGLMIWDFASDSNPDIVFVGIGDYMTKEALVAIDILKNDAPELRVRFVNIMELSALGIGNSECRAPLNFDDYFTADKPVVFNFHGYPEVLKGMLFDQKNPQRFRVHGYIENGSTTTPFDMHVRNKTSRWHLAMEAVSLLREKGVIGYQQAEQLIAAYKQKLDEHADYIRKYGVDPEEIENWTWKRNISS